MKKFLFLYFLLISISIYSQTLSGIVVTDDSARLPKTLVVNMSSDQKVWSNELGEFSINAKPGDEIRFVKENYEREKVIVSNNLNITVRLSKIPMEIEEVKIENKRVAEAKKEELRKSIGLPKGPEKPREKPAEAVNDILMPLIGIPPTIKIQAIYDVLSGKSRRLKRLYKYEDLQEGLAWIRNNVDLEYFSDAGIAPERFNDFLIFSLRDEKVLMYMKAKNLGGITISLDNNIKDYLERIAQK
ncbi:carboxypeptidase regulatory-like domain-containing protein [Epilithonimonas xixisoli]|uniref:Carboxypeptidase-like protein n=1 Tax=Epilithonimonas xixisoli TaxID=1476462 RepID=A0A4R8IGR4_9FLAO|nr:carboxypeptidase regulatory-like domain-containing protein [Epilithonimonas xixisoli]TDX86013.1 hypothetical protein B0I22_0110 [Epilithonimonas xixisoli]